MLINEEQLIDKVIDWHLDKYPDIRNKPNEDSYQAILDLVDKVLMPVAKHFGNVSVSYGFTSYKLMREIQKRSPKNTAPRLDQHAAHELNSKGDYICNRLGGAADIYVNNCSSADLVTWLCENTEFDRLYYYAPDRPVHVSVSLALSNTVCLMKVGEGNRTYPGSRIPASNINNFVHLL